MFLKTKKEKKIFDYGVDRILGIMTLIVGVILALDVAIFQTKQITPLLFTFIIPLLLFIKGINALLLGKTSVYVFYTGLGACDVTEEKYARIIGIIFIVISILIFIFFYNLFY